MNANFLYLNDSIAVLFVFAIADF